MRLAVACLTFAVASAISLAGCGSSTGGSSGSSSPASTVTSATGSAAAPDLTGGGVLSEENLGLGYDLTQRALEGSPGATPEGCPEMYSGWFVNPVTTYKPWVRSTELFEAAGPLLCYTPTVVGPPTIDVPATISSIEKAINSGADFVLTCVLDPNAFKNVLAKAADAGVVVVNIACGGTPDLMQFGYTSEARGKMACEAFVNWTGGNAKIAAILASPDLKAQNDDLKAMQSACESNPGVEVAQVLYDGGDASVSAKKAVQALAADPGINVIWTVGGTGGETIQSALQQAKRQKGEVKVLASDLQPAVCQGISDGWITGSQYYLFFDSSPLAARFAVDKVRGTFVPSDDGIETGNGPIVLVTQENLPSEICGA